MSWPRGHRIRQRRPAALMTRWNVHLAALYLVLERQWSFEAATNALGKLVELKKRRFEWLERPASLGAITVNDVIQAQTPDEHARVVRTWAESVWQAWSAHAVGIAALVRPLG